jgi:hypothetical protein
VDRRALAGRCELRRAGGLPAERLDRRERDHAAAARVVAVTAADQGPGGHAEREQHRRERGRGEGAQDERSLPPARAAGRGGRGRLRRRCGLGRQRGQRRDVGRGIPDRGLQRLEARDDGAQARDLGRQAGIGGERGLEARALGVGQLAEQVVGDVVARAHAPRSSASIRSRSRARPWTIRIFTVPSGMPVAAAISVWLAPP